MYERGRHLEQLRTLSLVTQNPTLRLIIERIDAISQSDSSILLIGETGVGKELFAEYIHRTSNRADNPFVKIGLSSLPPDLLESELFGHDKGAFTSAVNDKKGLFEIADTGSIFLDDIDDFPFALQSKLLRVLESRELKRVGGLSTIPIDVRLVAASKMDLKELVDRGLFRADLYYRINVVPFIIPPLRERKEDIPLLVRHFFRRFLPNKETKISDDALRVFVEYEWPGNVRELRNVVQCVSLFAKEVVELQDLPPEFHLQSSTDFLIKACHQCFVQDKMTFDQAVECLETNLLQYALKETGGNKTQAAQRLKLSLSTLRDKLKKYNLNGAE